MGIRSLLSHRHENTSSCKQSGFTLIELVITLSIIAILIPAAFSMFLANLRAQTKVLVLQEVKRNGDSALSTIETLIASETESLEQLDGTPVCATSGSSYSGDIYFVDDNSERFMFHETGSRIASESATTDYLTTDDVIVSNFSLTCERDSQFSGALISISYDVDQAQSTTRAEETASLSYQTKLRLRNL